MNLITPFRGIRPQVKFAKKISSPNINYFNNFKLSKKKNFLNILNNPNISYSNKILKKLKKNKIIFQDKKDNYYLYKISFKKKYLLGIVGKINLKNYDDKKILGHEETFPDRIRKRKQGARSGQKPGHEPCCSLPWRKDFDCYNSILH